MVLSITFILRYFLLEDTANVTMKLDAQNHDQDCVNLRPAKAIDAAPLRFFEA